MKRITNVSRDDIKKAESAKIFRNGLGFSVQLSRLDGGELTFVYDASGVIVYNTIEQAARMLQRINQSIEITTYVVLTDSDLGEYIEDKPYGRRVYDLKT